VNKKESKREGEGSEKGRGREGKREREKRDKGEVERGMLSMHSPFSFPSFRLYFFPVSNLSS